jgi:hypothetical protein
MPPGIAALSFEQQRLTPYGTNIQGLAKATESFPRKRESPLPSTQPSVQQQHFVNRIDAGR